MKLSFCLPLLAEMQAIRTLPPIKRGSAMAAIENQGMHTNTTGQFKER